MKSSTQQGLELRQDYFGDKPSFTALAELLHQIFNIDISLQDRFGGPDPSSMPFGYFDANGRCVANFSVFTMPLVVDGTSIKAAGYQSGAVLPEYRGRGLYRDLMQRAFAWAEDTGHDAGLLLTDKPLLYKRYGFRSIPQTKFCGPCPTTNSKALQSRRLELSNSDDAALLSHLLETRTPASKRFAVLRQKEMFLLNACFDPSIQLTYVEALQTLAAWKAGVNGTFMLLDVAAPQMPTLADIAGAIQQPFHAVEVLFSPDQLDWNGEPRPYQGTCDLMLTGLGNMEDGAPFMLSPMADF